MAADDNVLGAALSAGIPLPHSCRAGRCASCKARLLAGDIAYPDGVLPPGIVASEAARGEVLLCQAQPRSDLRIATRAPPGSQRHAWGVLATAVSALSTGGSRVTLAFVGTPSEGIRPGKFLDVETAGSERERVPVVAMAPNGADVELLELAPPDLVRARGPFDTPR